MQPIQIASDGIVRFRANPIVVAFMEAARLGKVLTLNDVARMEFSDDDREQFAQLIGYSVSGFQYLSYASDATCAAAKELAAKLMQQ